MSLYIHTPLRTTKSIVYAALAIFTLTERLAAQQANAANTPPQTIDLRYEFIGGGKRQDGPPCAGARQNGRVVVEGKLWHFTGGAPTGAGYNGLGRVTVDYDGCDLKPAPPEQDPHCVIRYVASYDARISMHAKGADDSEREVTLVWRPRGPVTASVSGNCTSEYMARRQREVTERGYGISSTTDNFEFAARIAPNGIPRVGRHEEPIEEGDEGRQIWTIGAVADDVRITIDGPRCACLNEEEPAPKTADFSARASIPGGTFSRWVVTPEGDAPRELTNTGGATAALSVGVTRGTRRFTLSVSYTHEGKTYRSEPHAVTVCVMDSVYTADGIKDFSFTSGDPGRAVVDVRSRATVAGRDASPEIKWTLEPMNGGTTLSPAEATGSSASFTYETLPTKNDAFGKKRVTTTVASEGCECTRASFVRIFFPPLATNNPSGTALERTANFFYYWMQSPAVTSGVNTPYYAYRPVLLDINGSGGVPAIGRFVPGEDRIYIARAIMQVGCRGRPLNGTRSSGPGNTGIDCFAETLRHEWQHRVDYQTWWPNGYDDPSTVAYGWDFTSALAKALATDADGDKVPASLEATLPGCRDAVAIDEASRRRNMYSCDGRPFDDVTDMEIYAYYAGWKWQRGKADDEDWSCGGKQWRGKACPQ